MSTEYVKKQYVDVEHKRYCTACQTPQPTKITKGHMKRGITAADFTRWECAVCGKYDGCIGGFYD